jgi:hypothetical protein
MAGAFTQTFEVGSGPATYVQMTSLSSAVGLAGGNGRRVILQAEAQVIRWRADGVDPTAAIGMTLAAGESVEFRGDLKKLRFIEAVGGGILNATIFK